MLDTYICIYLIRRRPREVLAKLAGCVENDVVMSAITLAELRYGGECRAADRTVQEDKWQPSWRRCLLSHLIRVRRRPTVQSDLPRERATDALDKLIATHASLSLGLTLVTNNERNFRAYPGLLIENWASTVSA